MKQSPAAEIKTSTLVWLGNRRLLLGCRALALAFVALAALVLGGGPGPAAAEDVALPRPNPMRGEVSAQPQPLALPARRPQAPARGEAARIAGGVRAGEQVPTANRETRLRTDPEPGSDSAARLAEAELRYRQALVELRAAEAELRRTKRERRQALRLERRHPRQPRVEGKPTPEVMPPSRKGAVPPNTQPPAPQQTAKSPAEPANPSEPVIATSWSAEEIAAARDECKRLLKGTGAVYDLVAPVRQGQCGTPAPIKLRRIGNNPAVRLEPPAVLNCQMAEALGRWLDGDMQSLARGWLAGEIVSISNASAYVCRNRYNDPNARLSEHATANALDISSFKLRDGARISLSADWGETRRDVEARLAQAAGTQASQTAAANSEVVGAGSSQPAKANATPQALETKGQATTISGSGNEISGFLREAHRSACGIFGTVLGPEANDAHRDHFHLDLAPRKRSNFCE